MRWPGCVLVLIEQVAHWKKSRRKWWNGEWSGMTDDPRTTFVPEEDRTAADRERLLARTFLHLADTMVDDFDVVEFLHRLSADSVSLLNAEAAGVMLDDGRGGLRLIASSEERMRLLEL